MLQILHHLSFAKSKGEAFCGREPELTAIRRYVKENEWKSGFMLYGDSGHGEYCAVRG